MNWTTYKGLELPDGTPTGDAGNNLKENFKSLADRNIDPTSELGGVVYVGGSVDDAQLKEDSSNLYWSETDKRLGIGTDSPSYTVDVVSNASASGPLRLATTTNADAFVLDSTGRIGIGTVPATDIHVKNGNYTTLRIETLSSPAYYTEIENRYDSANRFNLRVGFFTILKEQNLNGKSRTTVWGYNEIAIETAIGAVALGDTNGIEFRISNSPADPTTSDISAGFARIMKNTTSGQVFLAANDGSTIKKVLLS